MNHDQLNPLRDLLKNKTNLWKYHRIYIVLNEINTHAI